MFSVGETSKAWEPLFEFIVFVVELESFGKGCKRLKTVEVFLPIVEDSNLIL